MLAAAAASAAAAAAAAANNNNNGVAAAASSSSPTRKRKLSAESTTNAASTAHTASAGADAAGAGEAALEDCSVCLERVLERGELDCCAHMFCFSCVKRWAESENSCPLCKQRFHSIVRVDLSQPAQTRKAQKIRVAQRNQSARANLGQMPSRSFVATHLRTLVQLMWPDLAQRSIHAITDLARRATAAPLMPAAAAAAAGVPASVIDLLDEYDVPVPAQPEAPLGRPHIIDLTLLEDDDDDGDDGNNVVRNGSQRSAASSMQMIDLTLDDDDDGAGAGNQTVVLDGEDVPAVQSH